MKGIIAYISKTHFLERLKKHIKPVGMEGVVQKFESGTSE
jgi:hypothetical protein